MAIYSSWPPPIVPKIADAETSMKAPFSRGVEPLVPATSTKASRPAPPRKAFKLCTFEFIVCIPTREI
jgi:hypothetical protein